MKIKIQLNIKKFAFFLTIMCSFLLTTTVFANTVIKNNFFIKGNYEEAGLSIKYTGIVKFFVSSETKKIDDLAFNYKLASFYIEEVTYEGKTYRGHDLFGISFPYESLVNIEIDSKLTYKNQSNFEKELLLRSNKYEMFLLSDADKQKLKSLNVTFAEIDKGLGFKFKILKTLKITKLFENDLFVLEIIDRITNNTSEKSQKDNEEEYLRLLTEGNIRLSENNYEQALFSFLKAKKYSSNTDFVEDKIEIVDSYLNRSRSKFRWKNKNQEKAVTIDPILNLKNDLKINASFDSFNKEKSYYKLIDKANKYIIEGNYKKAITELNQSKKYTNNKVLVNKGIAIINDKIKKGGSSKPNKLSISEQSRKEKEKKEKEALFADYKQFSETRKSKKITTDKKITNNSNKKKIRTKVAQDEANLSYGDLLRKGGEYLKNGEYVASQKTYKEARKKAADKSAIDRILVSVNKLADAEKRRNKSNTATIDGVDQTRVKPNKDEGFVSSKDKAGVTKRDKISKSNVKKQRSTNAELRTAVAKEQNLKKQQRVFLKLGQKLKPKKLKVKQRM
ncbi:hypothetical protein [Aquimarina agarivorans]|uniref:hypothetical protein n=1 Tax=Aquimarina agarivorans TaxID=980584 RepID=UPI00031D9C2B|nr:hypothetical protein [Aquimarina agarivorans]